jgi:DNA-binding winged helix-turn-helix (wHTH) protein
MPPNKTDVELSIVDFGEFRMDFDLRCVYHGTDKVKVGPTSFKVLAFLVRERHRVVSKVELLTEVWGGERTGSTVEQAISQLRRVLQDNSAERRYIETIPGHGYRFVAQVLFPSPSIGEQDQAPPTDDLPPHSPTNGISVAVPPSTAPQDWGLARRGPMNAFWLVGALVVCIAAIAAGLHFREQLQIVNVAPVGNTLIAKGITGNILWTYRFDDSLRATSPEEANWRTQVVDLNGNGDSEVLVAAAFVNPPGPWGREEIFCFSSHGKVLWHYVPEIHMEFNTRDLNGPWRVTHMLVVNDGNSKSVWVAVGHTIWWPAFVVKISPNGRHETAFTSSGAIYTLLNVRTKSGSYVLAGGINNEYRMASVAVLATSGLPATSPQSDGAKYQCIRGCPNGRPYRYILLPRSELNTTSDRPYNEAVGLNARARGITIRTVEVAQTGTAQYFDFSDELQPERVVYSGDFAEIHRRYEREGRVAHSFEFCPERRSPALVRVFDENGISRLISVPRVPIE